VISAPMQLEPGNEWLRLPSLELVPRPGFEQHLPEHRECVECAGRLIGERHIAKGCQERDDRFPTPMGNGNVGTSRIVLC